MTGWFLAFGLAALTFLAMLLVGRIPRSAREISAAALLLGLAGYAWQGNPGRAGAPRAAKGIDGGFDEALAEQRRGLAERYGPAGQWLVMSDGLGRQGKTRDAANILLSGLRATPNDPNLWIGLGNALVAHADGTLAPSADFAYRRAIAVGGDKPAPRYFYGLALARAGQLQAARDQWATLAAAVPPGSEMQAELNANIARIDALLAGRDPASP